MTTPKLADLFGNALGPADSAEDSSQPAGPATVERVDSERPGGSSSDEARVDSSIELQPTILASADVRNIDRGMQMRHMKTASVLRWILALAFAVVVAVVARLVRESASKKTLPAEPVRVEAPKSNALAHVSTNGWLRIGGTELWGKNVEIDGVARGHAPLEVELPTGSHDVTIRDASGAAVIRKTVVLSALHTRANAVRVIRWGRKRREDRDPEGRQ